MKIISTITLLMIAFIANAQVYKVQKVWSFVTESMPGQIMQDENGNKIMPVPIIERFIYIETNYKAEPKIESISLNGKQYQSAISAINKTKYQAGSMYSDGKPFYITPKKGNKLWRIVITSDDAMPGSNEVKLITIKGKLGKSSFKQTLYTEIRLTGPEYQ